MNLLRKFFTIRCLLKILCGFVLSWLVRSCLLPYDIVIFKSDLLFSISSISTLSLGSLLRIFFNELKNPFLDINLANYFYDLSTKVLMGPGTSVESDKLNSRTFFCSSAGDAGAAGGASAPANVNPAQNPMNIQNIVNPVRANQPKPMNIQSLLNPVQDQSLALTQAHNAEVAEVQAKVDHLNAEVNSKIDDVKSAKDWFLSAKDKLKSARKEYYSSLDGIIDNDRIKSAQTTLISAREQARYADDWYKSGKDQLQSLKDQLQSAEDKLEVTKNKDL